MVTGSGLVTNQNTKIGTTMLTNQVNTTASHQLTGQESIKRPNENRRSNKPFMEKKRRARINNCLNQLKTLILDATKKDPARHSKLEKADILEKTVKYLQDLQRQQSIISQAANPKVLNKFKAGYMECVNQVERFPGLEPDIRRCLVQHLTSSMKMETDHQPMQPVSIRLLPQSYESPPSSPEQEQVMQSQNIHLYQPTLTIPASTNGHYINYTYVNQSNGMPTLVQIPRRTASTGSATSNSSQYDNRLSLPDQRTSPPLYTSTSPMTVYESAMDCSSVIRGPIRTNTSSYVRARPYSPVPLSLVMRKSIAANDEEKPWRPW